MGTFNKLVLGQGTLKIDAVDVGFLNESAEFMFGYDHKEFESGTPLALQGVVPIRHFAYFKTGMMEVKQENAAILLRGMSVQTVGDKKRLNLGIAPVNNLVKVEFKYTHPVTLKTIDIVMWKAYCDAKFNPVFKDNDWTILKADFYGVYDGASHPLNPLGYVDFQQ